MPSSRPPAGQACGFGRHPPGARMNTESQRPPPKAVHVDHADGTFARGSEADAAQAPPGTAPLRRQRVQAAQTRLLYENASTSVVVSVLIALPLAYAHRRVISTLVISTWLLSVVVVALLRWVIARRYWRAAPGEASGQGWPAAFVAGTALAASAWAIAGMLFYDPAHPTNGFFLMFVLGGVMLGGASLLAARREAFLTFFLPIGLLTAIRLASEGGEEHLMMAFLVILFTAATVATTWRFHLTIASSLELRFDNLDLIENLRAAKRQADALNRDLELRVRDRTSMLTEA